MSTRLIDCGQSPVGAKISELMQSLQLAGLSKAELFQLVQQLGEPPFRGQQIFQAIQHRRVRSFEEITDLPKSFRVNLAERGAISTLTLESRYLSTDGTRRYLMKTHDNLPGET